MSRKELIKATAEVPIGGSEDEAARAVQRLFKPELDPDRRYKQLSEDDIAEMDRIHDNDIQNECR